MLRTCNRVWINCWQSFQYDSKINVNRHIHTIRLVVLLIFQQKFWDSMNFKVVSGGGKQTYTDNIFWALINIRKQNTNLIKLAPLKDQPCFAWNCSISRNQSRDNGNSETTLIPQIRNSSFIYKATSTISCSNLS